MRYPSLATALFPRIPATFTEQAACLLPRAYPQMFLNGSSITARLQTAGGDMAAGAGAAAEEAVEDPQTSAPEDK